MLILKLHAAKVITFPELTKLLNKKCVTRIVRGCLEGVADGDVEAEGILEAGDVVVARTACVIGRMDADANVETQDKEVEIVAEAEASAEGYVVSEVLGVDGSTRAVFVGLHEPYVACVEEDGTVEVADERETVLDVGFKFHVAGLVRDYEGVIHLRKTRTDCSCLPSSQTVGTSCIEVFFERKCSRVSVCVTSSGKESCSNGLA